ncbi:Lrp/AsnC family transcriptional regulator [Paenibacillus gorillae]|uniref:Lrp/AsnC family transcriptional regulator n=1 Tax=Paenibacillus gorillae TaxID=1243662 RepID=UPI0004B4E422|nr:Lrp/AsnC family transcriptional regulator [Paenibacillus gorillae]
MDPIDKQILFHLQNQARMSMTELGKCVNLSQPAVTERVKRMEEKGIIEQYRTIISNEKTGKHTTAFMLFRTSDCHAFLDFVQTSPHVIECHRISGEHNYLMKVITESNRSLEEFGNSCDKYGTYSILIAMSSPVEYKNPIFSLDE